MKPYDLEKLASPLVKLYMKIEDDLLTCIAQRLEKNLVITDTAKWELHMLAQMGSLNKDAAKIIAQRAREAPYMLRVALETAAQEAIDSLEPTCKEAAKKGYAENTKIPPSRRVQQAVQAYWKQAKRRQNLVNTVMRYKVKPAWISLIKGIRGYIDKDVAKQPVYDVLNKHTGAAIIGTETRQQAVRKAIEELLDKGIPAFVDKRGREWSPEAYINMDIRTTANNVAHQAQFDRLDDYDLDLVEVSSHSGARPKCFKDQGKLYSRKNKSGTVTDLHGHKIRYYPWNSSSYGEPDGILGINCGHHIYPFFPGMSTMRYKTTQSQAENDRIYKESQTQRALERKIRRDKQECNMYNALGDKEAYQKASTNLKASRQALKDFIDRTGRRRKPEREQIIGFDRSQSAKAVTSAKQIENLANSMYDIGSPEENVKAYYRDLPIRKKIQTELNKTIQVGKQNKHIPGSHEYKQYVDKLKKKGQFGPSRLTISIEDAQKLIDQYHGTGILGYRHDGVWDGTELITVHQNEIGIAVNNQTGKEAATTTFKIHYSKNGSHIVPDYPSKKGMKAQR